MFGNNFNTFEEWLKWKNYMDSEAKKIEEKSKKTSPWKFVAIYSFLGITFPFFLGLVVFVNALARHYASLF